MTRFRHPAALTLIVIPVLVALSVGAAPAQQPPASPTDAQMRVQRSAQLQRQALQSLADHARAERLVASAYTELQEAISAMVIRASGMKFKDPLLDINRQRGEAALVHLQTAGDALRSNRVPPSLHAASEGQEHAGQPSDSRSVLDEVRQNLEQALRLTNTLSF